MGGFADVNQSAVQRDLANSTFAVSRRGFEDPLNAAAMAGYIGPPEIHPSQTAASPVHSARSQTSLSAASAPTATVAGGGMMAGGSAVAASCAAKARTTWTTSMQTPVTPVPQARCVTRIVLQLFVKDPLCSIGLLVALLVETPHTGPLIL